MHLYRAEHGLISSLQHPFPVLRQTGQVAIPLLYSTLSDETDAFSDSLLVLAWPITVECGLSSFCGLGTRRYSGAVSRLIGYCRHLRRCRTARQATITDQASYRHSTRPSAGIQQVLVNGTFVVRDGGLEADARPGRPVRASPQ